MFDTDLDTPVDRLEQALVAAEQLIAQTRMRQAAVLRALDTGQTYSQDGAGSLQEWTRARLDVSDATARDLVTAARSAPEQMLLLEMTKERDMSFDRLVATSRLIASGATDETVERSFGYDLAGVARLRHRQRRMTRFTEAHAFGDRYVTLQPTLDGAAGSVRAELPGFEFNLVGKALVERADSFRALPGPFQRRPQLMADALVSCAQDSLDAATPTPAAANSDSGHRSEPLVTVFVDAHLAGDTDGEAGAEVAYGPKVGPLTLERILCTGRVQVVGLADGRPVASSNAARDIPPATRRYVMWRDGGCVIGGCNSRYRLQPHHVRHRSDHGDHDPDNLATLCWFHHHVVIHGIGLRLDPKSPPQRRRFIRHSEPGPDPP